MRAFLDTNIVLDLFLDRHYDKPALDTLETMRSFGDIELWASSKSYADAFYVMRKDFPIASIYQAFEDSLEYISVTSVDKSDVEKAVASRWTDFEDCLINLNAEKIRADYLITRDANGFKLSSIPHGTASDFVSYVKDALGIEYVLLDEE